MSPAELELLTTTVAGEDGDHLEIGSMWGGTAIAAANATPNMLVVCVDPFTDADSEVKERPSEDKFLENVLEAGVADRVELHVCKSAPWPLYPRRRFGTVLIDGDHTAPWPETDWESARCVTDVILVHDVNEHEPAVAQLHRRVMDEGEWTLTGSAKFLYRYERAKT